MQLGSVVAQLLVYLPLVLDVRGLIPARDKKMFQRPNTISLVSFA